MTSHNTNSLLLDVRNLCVDYFTDSGTVRAVNNVSLQIQAGETLGLAGESGCGKSTLAFAIARLHKEPALISEGEIFFAGTDILSLNDDELAAMRWSQMSIVFQSAMNSLNPVITIGEQVIDVIQTHTGVDKKIALEQAADLLELVGIHSSRLKSFPHQLSGGMRQRVAIAIALALKPKLIIMDEPTTALDVVVEREIMLELQQLRKQFGFAVLFISHDLSLMGEISDHIGIMYAGKMVELGITENVMNAPRHPYTHGLLSSFPKIGETKQKRLQGIPGNPLNLLETPDGCYFQSRCFAAKTKCQTADPALVQTNNHAVACFYPVDGGAQ